MACAKPYLFHDGTNNARHHGRREVHLVARVLSRHRRRRLIQERTAVLPNAKHGDNINITKTKLTALTRGVPCRQKTNIYRYTPEYTYIYIYITVGMPSPLARDSVRDSVRNSARNSAHNSVRISVPYSVRDSVRDANQFPTGISYPLFRCRGF